MNIYITIERYPIPDIHRCIFNAIFTSNYIATILLKNIAPNNNIRLKYPANLIGIFYKPRANIGLTLTRMYYFI